LAVLLAMLTLSTGALAARVGALEVVRVADGVYAIVGPLGQRTMINYGNNATFGAVITDDGVVLIDPGGSAKGAAAIERALRTVTDLPVTHVINTGGQDHRWLGNGHFKAKGATIIASADAVLDQETRAGQQLQALRFFIDDTGLEGTEPVHADWVFENKLDLEVGGVRFEIRHPGGAHTPGDSYVWLPEKSVVFTGDIAYVERLLAVLDISDSAAWIESFNAMAEHDPLIVVPGHGHPTDLITAQAQTLDYLTGLRRKIRAVLDAGGDIVQGTAVDQSEFADLKNFDQLSRRNAQAVYIEMEFD
jgi:glyoxylase-like metal-dependent hydrolase (beta-lactamase superfamily II)